MIISIVMSIFCISIYFKQLRLASVSIHGVALIYLGFNIALNTVEVLNMSTMILSRIPRFSFPIQIKQPNTRVTETSSIHSFIHRNIFAD